LVKFGAGANPQVQKSGRASGCIKAMGFAAGIWSKYWHRKDRGERRNGRRLPPDHKSNRLGFTIQHSKSVPGGSRRRSHDSALICKAPHRDETQQGGRVGKINSQRCRKVMVACPPPKPQISDRGPIDHAAEIVVPRRIQKGSSSRGGSRRIRRACNPELR